MRKPILSICLFLITMQLHAQIQKGWYAEDFVTVGNSWYTHYDNSFHFHLQTGANLIYQFNKTIGLGSGLAFSTEGNTHKYASITSNTKVVQRNNYVRVPVFARVVLNSEGKTIPYFDGGFSMGFLVSGKQKFYADDELKSNEKNTPINKNDVGLLANLGVAHQLHPKLFLKGYATYYRGFVQQEALDGGNGPTITNSHAGIGIGLCYRL
ncbi:MAG: outer membrane beta-barrel protein [Niabella sp.]